MALALARPLYDADPDSLKPLSERSGVFMSFPSDHGLVIAAATAVGECRPGEEAAWSARVRHLAVEMHLIGVQVHSDIQRLESCAKFVAVLVDAEVERSSDRGLLTLRTGIGETEHIRTDRLFTDAGRATFERAQSLKGQRVLIYRQNEAMASDPKRNVRVVVHLADLGPDTAEIPVSQAKQMVLDHLRGDTSAARQAWGNAELPHDGEVQVRLLEKLLRTLDSGSDESGA